MEVEDDNAGDETSSCASFITAGKQICIVGECAANSRITEAAHSFGLPVVFENWDADWQKYECPTVFILPEFRDCEKIQKSGHSIFGPTALLELAEKKVPIPSVKRPLYSHAMDGLVVCFTGFREKSTLAKLMVLVHNMGGHIRREMVSRVTHLIAHCCGGEKYQYALTFRVAIMNESWIHFAWSNRHNPFFSATAPEVINEHKLQVFSGARICFVGFPEEEKSHMIEILVQNGGEPTDLNDQTCTHIVFDSEETFELFRTKVVVPYSPNSVHRYTPRSYFALPNAPRQNLSLTPASAKIHFSPSRKRVSTPASHSILTAPASNISSILNDSLLPFTPTSLDYSSMNDLSQKSDIEKNEMSFTNTDQCNSSLKRLRNSSLVATSSSKRFKPSDKKNIRFLSSNCILDRNYLSEKDANREDTPFKSMISTETRKLKISDQSFKNASFLHCKRGLNFDSPAQKIKTDAFIPELPSIVDTPPRNSAATSPQFKTPLPPIASPPMSPPSASSSISAQRSLVVDESTMDCLPPAASLRVHIVKAEWFWASVQNEGCVDEKDYLLEDHLESIASPCATPNLSGMHTGSSSKRGARKRKRLRDCLVQTKDALSPTQYKRRSSISGRLSCGSLLDYTASPDSHLHDEVESNETPRKNLSARHQVCLELVQTESNYVNILNTIMTLFKNPLEAVVDTENELLNHTELKIIFGHLPPIHQTHVLMLEELKQLVASSWREENSIGNIFLNYSSNLMKAYPPFINFFENMREMLLKCDQTKPRFHAFLKVCQTKPECGRQTLVELLIRPVQRLPSISLLLTDILKHTSKSNPDYCALEAALASIREVMTHINEDKRRTESQLAVFDIFNDIENCPPHLVSSHRSFISRCDVVEISDSLSGRGDSLAFFLFSDIVEICKKRSKAFNTLKSPKEAGVKVHCGKMFKHVKLMHLSTVKRVIDINETDDCRKVFALMCRNNQELKEKLFSFAITDDSVDKMTFLRSLCRQMANTVCRADAENFLASLDPEQLDIDTSDVSTGTLSKAFKFASRTRIKVGRAFSFNKTPSRLKRAMSTMMSPFVDSSQLS